MNRYKIVDARTEKLIYSTKEPMTAKEVMEVLRWEHDGLYYVISPHWLTPIAKWEGVMVVVPDTLRSEMESQIQDALDYQQK